MIARLARRYWTSLPPNIQRFYTPDDMIAEVRLHVLIRQHKYNPQRASTCTFVHWVAERYCQVIVQRYHAMKRAAYVIGLDEVSQDMLGTVPPSYLTHATQVVEAVIRAGSDDLRRFLNALLCEGSARPPSPSVACELRMIARQCRATWRDFALVRRLIADDQYA